MSRKLVHAISKGKVEVQNRTSGEVRVLLIMDDGKRRAVDIPPFAVTELSPRLTSLKLIKRSPNLKSLLKKHLKIV